MSWSDRIRALAAGEVEPVAPRRAATVLLLRDGPSGPEVYVLRRRATMAFAAGMYAFPGGSVDARDSAPAVLPEAAAEAWAARLGTGSAAVAREVLCAAVRETFEESGVLLAGDPLAVCAAGDGGAARGPGGEAVPGGADAVQGGAGAAPTGPGEDPGAGGAGRARPGNAARAVVPDAEREALAAHRQSLSDLLTRRALPLRADLLAPWARWVTPEFEERRFDTFFFVAELPAGQRTRDVSGEADRTLWTAPAEAVAGHDAGHLAMLPPTLTALRELARYGTVAEIRAAAAERPMAPVTPRASASADGRLVLEWNGASPGSWSPPTAPAPSARAAGSGAGPDGRPARPSTQPRSAR